MKSSLVQEQGIAGNIRRLPDWLKQSIPDNSVLRASNNISHSGINTICQEAACPNLSDCFKRNQAAFLILGKVCTRNCAFCNVQKDKGEKLNIDSREPERIARLTGALGLKYAVVTSVTRDDLADGGASQFVKVIEAIAALGKDIKVEVLIPDFKGNTESLRAVIKAGPFILAHNLETVKRLYRKVRPQADYKRSLLLLSKAKELSSSQLIKSSLMLGLGEKEEEVVDSLKDLRGHGCDIVTLGQYLAPTLRHYPVNEFISPEQFRKYYDLAISLGFKKVFSGPKVRSSYYAEDLSRELAYA